MGEIIGLHIGRFSKKLVILLSGS